MHKDQIATKMDNMLDFNFYNNVMDRDLPAG